MKLLVYTVIFSVVICQLFGKSDTLHKENEETFHGDEESSDYFYDYVDDYVDNYFVEHVKQTTKNAVQNLNQIISDSSSQTCFSGFTRMKRFVDGNEILTPQKSYVSLASDPFLTEVKNNYGCISLEEKLLLENDLFEIEEETTEDDLKRNEILERAAKQRELDFESASGNVNSDYKTLAEKRQANIEAMVRLLDEEGGDGGGVINKYTQVVNDPLPSKKKMDIVVVSAAQHMGSDCEKLMCISCGIVVAELSRAVALMSTSIGKTTTNQPPISLDNVLKEVCQSKVIQQKYSELVYEVCKIFQDSMIFDNDAELQSNMIIQRANPYYWHGKIMAEIFEKEMESNGSFKSWADKMSSDVTVSRLKATVCSAVGACLSSNSSNPFSESTGAINSSYPVLLERREDWSTQCKVCQAIGSNIEANLQLLRRLDNDQDVTNIIKSTCDRLSLTIEEESRTCIEIIFNITQTKGGDQSLDEIAWMARLHGEGYTAKKDRNPAARLSLTVAKGKGFYADKLCETLKLCDKWESKAQKSYRKLSQEVEAVFF